jgi:hypothetical protein
MNNGNFWGSARDIGLVAVGILSFAGAVYTYSYVHILGIDFSLANTSPVAMLISASRVFITNDIGAVAAAIVSLGLAAAISTQPQDPGVARVRAVIDSKTFQVGAVVAIAFAACLLAYKTARDEIGFVRSGHANPATITFAPNADVRYPRLVRDFNSQSRLLIVLDTTDNLYVLVQQPRDPTIVTLPDAQVFSIRKSDIVSVETHVP